MDSRADDRLFDARFFMNSLAPSPDGKMQRMATANFDDRDRP